jgi:large subunit ribosomal protein L21
MCVRTVQFCRSTYDVLMWRGFGSPFMTSVVVPVIFDGLYEPPRSHLRDGEGTHYPSRANSLQLSDFGCTLSPFAQVPMMYAIIQTNGRQVRVTPGGFTTIDGTAGEPGAKLTLESVLLVETDAGEVLAGAPFVANARVLAVVDGETRGPKIRVFKKKRRKGMRRTKGHRATFTRVRVTDILV